MARETTGELTGGDALTAPPEAPAANSAEGGIAVGADVAEAEEDATAAAAAPIAGVEGAADLVKNKRGTN